VKLLEYMKRKSK